MRPRGLKCDIEVDFRIDGDEYIGLFDLIAVDQFDAVLTLFEGEFAREAVVLTCGPRVFAVDVNQGFFLVAVDVDYPRIGLKPNDRGRGRPISASIVWVTNDDAGSSE